MEYSIFFCSFADSSMLPSLKRIKKQALNMGVFKRGGVRLFTEKSLPFYAKRRCNRIISATGTKRGYGYWSWKPAVIKKVLNKMKANDILLYCDAGCHLNPKAKDKLLHYIDIVGKQDILVTGLTPEYNSYSWTKMDTNNLFKDKLSEKDFMEGQLQATTIFLKKNPYTINLIERWDRLMDYENLHYFDDSPSILPNHPSFHENRHDQSLFTLLLRSNHFATEPVCNFTPESPAELERLWREEPILQLRDRQKSKSKLKTIIDFKETIRIGIRRKLGKIKRLLHL
ncbi:MAG: hypothetical protein IJU95_01020 [Treponema sp.]|nr:hypothetical protein [Treponema sp.]